MPSFLSTLVRGVKIILCLDTKPTKGDDYLTEKGSGELRYEPIGVDWTLLLPHSVLNHIFIYFTYSTIHPATSPCIEANPRHGPLLLAQISSRWRCAALGTPLLWSSIYVGSQHHPAILKLWLERSGTLPLSLRLDGVYDLREIAVANEKQLLHPSVPHPLLKTSVINQALRLLSTQIHRWKKVSFALDIQSAQSFLDLPLTDPPLGAILLEEVAIQIIIRDADYTGIPYRILDFLRSSMISLPSFRRLTWESIPSTKFDINCHPIWAQLSTIHISTGMTMDESVTFLSQCRSASDVALHCISNDWMDSPELQRPSSLESTSATAWIVLPNLKRLSIGMGGAACDCTLILQRFAFPSLRSLQFQNFQTSHRSYDLLEDFLTRSFKSVAKHLELESETSSRSLQHLLIKDDYMSEDILLRLVCTPILRRSSSLNLHTRKPVQWDFFLRTLQSTHPILAEQLEYHDYGSSGKWIGWGGLPGSDLY
ncbi:hypothetical protein BDZ97DRAFT_1821870 [Flammula alnicola]|nr:hypothetical protein BDZ97DRAFT_1821870 [Flammula alnicola]